MMKTDAIVTERRDHGISVLTVSWRNFELMLYEDGWLTTFTKNKYVDSMLVQPRSG